jgi:hypothetical protein
MFTKMIKSILVIAGCSLGVSAHASLTINNQTKLDSTAIIEGGMCSKDLPGGGGITKAGTSNTISDFIIGLACWNNPKECHAEVYMNDSCTGPHIASVVFNSKTGEIKYTMNSPDGDGYKVETGDFSVTLSGGPQLATPKLF